MSRLRLLLGSVLLALVTLLPLTLLVRGEWDPLRSWDNGTVEALEQPSGWTRVVALALTQLGAPVLLEVAALVIALTLVRRQQPRVGAFVVVGVLGAHLVSRLSQDLIGRVRPCVGLDGCPERPSFPSGHSVVAAAFWTTLVVLLLPAVGRRVWWLLAVPPVVALTRLLLGVHYPSDVIAGLLVGGCWAVAWAAVLNPWRRSPATARATERATEEATELATEEGVG